MSCDSLPRSRKTSPINPSNHNPARPILSPEIAPLAPSLPTPPSPPISAKRPHSFNFSLPPPSSFPSSPDTTGELARVPSLFQGAWGERRGCIPRERWGEGPRLKGGRRGGRRRRGGGGLRLSSFVDGKRRKGERRASLLAIGVILRVRPRESAGHYLRREGMRAHSP